MKYFDSSEATALRRLIDSKKKYLSTIKIEYSFQQLQKEIMLLEKDILPIVLNNTSVIHSEIAKYAIRSYDKALEMKNYGMLMYIPIDENYTNCPIIGVANIRANLGFGTPGAMELFAELINMDDNGAKPQPVNLNLDALMP